MTQAPSAHTLLAYHRRLDTEGPAMPSKPATGNGLDLALAYTRLLWALCADPAYTGVQFFHVTDAKTGVEGIGYKAHTTGWTRRLVAFFTQAPGHPTGALAARHREAMDILDGALEPLVPAVAPIHPGLHAHLATSQRHFVLRPPGHGAVHVEVFWEPGQRAALPLHVRMKRGTPV
jgi:hypothetical protein